MLIIDQTSVLMLRKILPFYRGYVRISVPQTVDVSGKDGAQESGYCADVVGGWIEGDGWVKAIVLARIKVVENFSKSSESCSGLAA
jgi:hypothetical protein